MRDSDITNSRKPKRRCVSERKKIIVVFAKAKNICRQDGDDKGER